MRHVQMDLTDAAHPIVAVDGVNLAPYAARVVVEADSGRTPIVHVEVSAGTFAADLMAEVRTVLEETFASGQPAGGAEAARTALIEEIRGLDPQQIESDALQRLDGLDGSTAAGFIAAIAEALS